MDETGERGGDQKAVTKKKSTSSTPCKMNILIRCIAVKFTECYTGIPKTSKMPQNNVMRTICVVF